MGQCSDAAVWGHYGESHQGVCLKFKTTRNQEQAVGLTMSNVIKGYSASKGGETKKLRGDEFFPLRQINYVKTFEEVDFFRSIGRLSWPRVQKTWFEGRNGATSSVAATINQSPERWRKRHWEVFSRIASTKLAAWQYEDEYRVVMSGMIDDLKEASDRVVNFRFADLAGIVFGMRTPIAAKHRIMKIIEQKCTEARRDDFVFYQAEYNPKDGTISPREMRAFKLSL